jgi:hypothetical protein
MRDEIAWSERVRGRTRSSGFEHIQQRHDGMKLMAYILINVRRCCTT